MYTVQSRELELLPAHHRADADNAVRAAWPEHRRTGARSSAAVLFELLRGTHLGTPPRAELAV
jgi:hypothetical protein